MKLNLNKKSAKEISDLINYNFKDENLLKNALVHSSYLNENKNCDCPNNERMEFLGDSILSMVISEHLFKSYTCESEKEMSLIRAKIVSRKNLYKLCKKYNLEKYIYCSKGLAITESVLANIFESLICAVYLDSDYETAYNIIINFFKNQLLDIVRNKKYYDSKMILQQYCLKYFSELPKYKTVKTKGPDHNKTFFVEVCVNNDIIGKGKGESVKTAEKKAAADVLKKIDYKGEFNE